MNNIAKYSALIELLSDAISFGINDIIIRLDSQLMVLQLTSIYTIINPTLLRLFLLGFPCFVQVGLELNDL